MPELSPEAFELKKELAQLGVAVATVRAELSSLEAEREGVLASYEADGRRVVDETLSAARDTLRQASFMVAEVVRWKDEVRSLASEVVSWSEKRSKSLGSEAEALAGRKKALDAKNTELAAVLDEINSLKGVIAGERKTLEAEKTRLKDGFRKLEADRSTLRAVAAQIDRKTL